MFGQVVFFHGSAWPVNIQNTVDFQLLHKIWYAALLQPCKLLETSRADKIKPTQACQTLQSLKWPLEVGSKSESLPAYVHLKTASFTEKNKQAKKHALVCTAHFSIHSNGLWENFHVTNPLKWYWDLELCITKARPRWWRHTDLQNCSSGNYRWWRVCPSLYAVSG